MTELAVRADTVGAFDPRNEKIVKYLGLDPADPKAVAVVAVARRYDLDPPLKHVIIITSGGRANIYITRDGLLHVAHSSGQLDGIVVDQEPALSDDGREWVARVSVYRKDMGHPFTFPGRYPVNGTNREYAQEMALKAAESHALRRAFSVAGLPAYDEQRAAQAHARAGTTAAPVTAAEILGETVEPDGEIDESSGHDRARDERRMFALLGELGIADGKGGGRDDRLAIYSALASRPIGSTKDLTDDEVDLVVNQLDTIRRLGDEDRAGEVGALIVDGGKTRTAGAP